MILKSFSLRYFLTFCISDCGCKMHCFISLTVSLPFFQNMYNKISTHTSYNQAVCFSPALRQQHHLIVLSVFCQKGGSALYVPVLCMSGPGLISIAITFSAIFLLINSIETKPWSQPTSATHLL